MTSVNLPPVAVTETGSPGATSAAPDDGTTAIDAGRAASAEAEADAPEPLVPPLPASAVQPASNPAASTRQAHLPATTERRMMPPIR
ncbi:hypothetical protein L1857_30710 [Amycolatopsis thermalba]|uniref:Uncharacterized protein n=1 Tax=Amycolatopsis thermalba TaxID=944492 RepID=A0ABY4P3J0_9PSEU|nr:hypothetical protein L1857_30710 [Amycolatopsis thermalba]